MDIGMGYMVTGSTGSGLGALGGGMGGTRGMWNTGMGTGGSGKGYGRLKGVAPLWWAIGVTGSYEHYGEPWGAMWVMGS